MKEFILSFYVYYSNEEKINKLIRIFSENVVLKSFKAQKIKRKIKF